MTRILRRTIALTAAGLATALTLSACGASKSNPLNSGPTKGTVTIGSANFAENVLLGAIYSDALQAKGVKVRQQFNVGSREIIYPLIKKGTISVLPEYNGALLSYLDPKATQSTTASVDAALKTALPSSLEILQASAAQDKDALAVTQATAQRYHLSAISDLTPYAKNMTLGGAPEFATRQQGVLGLKSVYGLNFKGFSKLGDDSPLVRSALQHGNIQIGELFTTDPYIETQHFTVLADPKDLFGSQNVIPLVNKSAATPTVVNTLNAISAKLTTATLVHLMKLQVVDKQDPDTIAKNWLSSVGLG